MLLADYYISLYQGNIYYHYHYYISLLYIIIIYHYYISLLYIIIIYHYTTHKHVNHLSFCNVNTMG